MAAIENYNEVDERGLKNVRNSFSIANCPRLAVQNRQQIAIENAFSSV